MKHHLRLACLALFFLAACGESTNDDSTEIIPAPVPFSEVAPSGASALTDGSLVQHIVFADDIPNRQRELLRNDLSIIDNWDGTIKDDAAERMKSLLGLTNADREELSFWLKQRLKYFVRDDLSRYNLGLIFPGMKQVGLQILGDAGKKEEENTGASNIGTALYMQTLLERESRPELAYLILQVNEAWVPVLSPRAGIMRIGPALFNPLFQVNGADLKAISNSLQTIEVLFHEARHSDGNQGSGSLGFPHVNCPNSSRIPRELRGQPACDDALNGAYSVGAAVLRGLWSLCNRNCIEKEIVILQSIYLDRLSRLVVDESDGEALDSSEEPGFNEIDFSAYQAFRLR